MDAARNGAPQHAQQHQQQQQPLGLDGLTTTATTDEVLIGLQQATREADLCKGYTPFLCFDVDDLDARLPAVLMMGAVLDGGVRHEVEGKMAVVRTPEGFFVAMRETHR